MLNATQGDGTYRAFMLELTDGQEVISHRKGGGSDGKKKNPSSPSLSIEEEEEESHLRTEKFRSVMSAMALTHTPRYISWCKDGAGGGAKFTDGFQERINTANIRGASHPSAAPARAPRFQGP